MATTRPVSTKTTATTRLDTSILAGVTLNANVPVTTGLASASTKAAGLAKGLNMFYKLLFTEKGSNPLNILEGTRLGDLYQSNITDIDTLFVDVKAAVDDAFEQLSLLQTRALAPADEKITSVTIVSLTTTVPDSAASPSSKTSPGPVLNFSLLFRNAAGDTSPYQVPSIVLT